MANTSSVLPRGSRAHEIQNLVDWIRSVPARGARAGQELRLRLHIELGEDGWLENSYFANGRDPIWYVTLINFTGPLLVARRFIEWFESNRDRTFAKEEFSHVDVCRWQFDGSRMTPKVVASVSLDQDNG